jgi:hypothetical protein
MTNHRGSTTARPVSGASEQLFNLTQGHIRPLIGLIERLNEIGAEDELRVIAAQLTRLVYMAQPPRPLVHKQQGPTRILSRANSSNWGGGR